MPFANKQPQQYPFSSLSYSTLRKNTAIPILITILLYFPFSLFFHYNHCLKLQGYHCHKWAKLWDNAIPILSSFALILPIAIANKHVLKQSKKMEEQIEMVGKAFVNHYYNLFDNDRSSLANLYQPTSMLSFEGQKILGVDDISTKLNNLPFDQCKHIVSTIDSQPSSFAGAIVVFVSGSLQLSGEDYPLRFSQMLHLIPVLQGGFFVQNDMFRLNYG